MRLFYVQGGGLGHLTRVNRFMQQLQIPMEGTLVVTTSSFYNLFRSWNVVGLDWQTTQQDWSEQLAALIREYRVTDFYIDSFPMGINGELEVIFNDFPMLRYFYLARILKWEFYQSLFTQRNSPIFTKSFIVETLYQSHWLWIKAQSTTAETIDLCQHNFPSIEPVRLTGNAFWLLAQSGGPTEVATILEQALHDRMMTNSTAIIYVFTHVDFICHEPNVIVHKNIYPVTAFYQFAQRIYTGGGFNSVHELRKYRDKHVAIPLEKYLDDQFFRVRQIHPNQDL